MDAYIGLAAVAIGLALVGGVSLWTWWHRNDALDEHADPKNW